MNGSFLSARATAALLLALSLGPGGQAAQQAPAQTPQSGQDGTSFQAPADGTDRPVFRTGINFVRVDVIATDRNGAVLTDLKQGDFEVTEDGKPQAIESFKLVKLDGGAMPTSDGPPREIRNDFDEETEAAKDEVRLFAIFLDDYHVRRGASMSVRNPIARFVETQLGPSDMVTLMYPLEPVSALRMTRNHAAIVAGLQKFVGRKFDYTVRNQFEEQYARYPAETVEKIRNQVSLTALRGLIAHMGGLKEGRKALILVSEGYSNMLPPQLRDPVATMPGFGNPDAGNPQAGVNDRNETTAAFFASADLEADLREVYAAANRYNVAIYAVDPRGLPGFESDIDQGIAPQVDRDFLNAGVTTLRTLSEQTDGRAIVGRNDIQTAMNQIIRDSSGYYLLGYNSTQTAPDGKFHQIKVQIKRPGVQVRARRGYWALNTEEAARSIAPKRAPVNAAVETALSSIVQPARARVVRTWIGTSRGENGKTKMTFVWEPIPKAPGNRPSGADDQPARVLITATGADGAAYFRGRVPDVALASASPQTAVAGPGAGGSRSGSSAPTPTKVTFDVPPGKMQMRLSVEGGDSQVLDSELRDIVVPDLSAPDAMSTPAVLRARTVREYQQLKTDPDAVPVATREFSRTERLLILVSAYGPGGSQPALTARLLNRLGQRMSDLTVNPPAAASAAWQVELPLAGLAPGEYLVEIKTGERDDAKQLVGFRVTG